MRRLLLFLFIMVFAVSCGTGISLNEAAENFKEPDDRYGVNCWWWWLNGNVTEQAIVSDLREMKEKGFCGAMIFDAGGQDQRGNKNVPAGPMFGSTEWRRMFTTALDEAEKLGLEIGFNIMSGWNLGGPCITAEHAAKRITFSDTIINGGREYSLQLSQPDSLLGFYKDIAVLAFKVDGAEISDKPIYFLENKLCARELGMSAPDCRYLLDNSKKSADGGKGKTPYIICRDSILDISDKIDHEGVLRWNIPEGRWTIMRIGYTCTGARVSTSSDTWKGFVIDYLSSRALDFYLKTVINPILETAGHHVGTTLKYLETDSWECGGMNWTEDFPSEFMRLNGYDIKTFLPVVGGYIIDNMDITHAFLADFRKSIGSCIARNHYGHLADYAHSHDMGVQPESGGPHGGPIDGIKNFSYSDIVMGEFWAPSPHRTTPESKFFIKQASSAAHIYGKKIIGAESFTTIGPHWNDEIWHDQKGAFDHEICAGLNRVYFHTFTCSPGKMGIPGQEYFAGTHINPRITWWNEGNGFIGYMKRIQFLAQEAAFHADILYYYGDHIPVLFPNKHSDPCGAIPGFDYDVTDEDALLQCTVDRSGDIVAPSGRTYRVLVLPDHKILSLAALEKVSELVSKGAAVIGEKPEKCISLAADHGRFKHIADTIWGNDSLVKRINYGKGVVACGIDARGFLLSEGMAEDFAAADDPLLQNTDFIHYDIDGHDVYFISNFRDTIVETEYTFRSCGRSPQLWNAVTGSIESLPSFTRNDNGTTTIPLRMDPCGSAIIVFGARTWKDGTSAGNYPEFIPATDITGPWRVRFEEQRGGPGEVVFDSLYDWTISDNEAIRYFSGHASYSADFYHKTEPGYNYHVDIGRVKDVGMATVKVNGNDAGLVWTSPFRVDIGKYLKEGKNTIEITVVNSWFNRVAGDQLHLENEQHTATNIILAHDFLGEKTDGIKLSSSGLLGPVQIIKNRK